MYLYRNKYLKHFLLKSLVTFGFIFSFSIVASTQVYYAAVVGKYPLMNPLLFDAFKKQVKPNPLLSDYIKPSKHELMYWRYFPLTIAQAEARNREWERNNKRSIGEQIAGDIAKDIIQNQINTLLYGIKTVPAVIPRF